MTRRVIVSLLISLDGRYEGPDHDLSVLPFDEGFNVHNLGLLQGAGTLLAGARTFRDFVAYWPSVADDPSQPETQREISRVNNGLEKVVISDTLTPQDAGAWQSTTRIVRRADAPEAVQALRESDAPGDIVVFGSATTWNPLLVAGLVDEVQLLVGPGFAGSGTPVFQGARTALRYLGSAPLEDSQLVLLRYAPA